MLIYCREVNGIRCDWDLNDGINYCDTPKKLLKYDAENGYITITNLPAGEFILKSLDLNYDINIYVTEYGTLIDKNRYNVNKNEIVESSQIKPLQISDIKELQSDDEKENKKLLEIKLNGTNDRTCVPQTHMLMNMKTLL